MRNLIFVMVASAWLAALPVSAEVITRDVTLSGYPVQVDIHSPDTTPRGTVVLIHGFMRFKESMGGHAANLSQEGYLAVVPNLPYLSGKGEKARALVELIDLIRDGSLAAPAERIVLVGFSAGGLTALLAAASPGVVGYIGLDPIDMADEGLEAAKKLSIPSVLLYGPPSTCNADRVARSWSMALPGVLEDRLIEGAGHCDFESPTDGMCTFFCGAVAPVRQQLIAEALVSEVKRLLPVPATEKSMPIRDEKPSSGYSDP